jgi:hypothetical protein
MFVGLICAESPSSERYFQDQAEFKYGDAFGQPIETRSRRGWLLK